MSTVNTIHTHIDIRTERLVSGYIRDIRIINQIIPDDIKLLCLRFYYVDILRIICLQQLKSGNYNLPSINIANIKSNTHFQGIMKSGDIRTQVQQINGSGICVAKNFKLPQTILNKHSDLNDKYFYNIVFHIGTGHNYTQANGYIINPISNNMNQNISVYHWKLPDSISPTRWTFALYSAKYGLMDIGGKCTNFNILKFSNCNELKWRKENNLAKERETLSAIMLNDDNLFCCAGSPSNKCGNYTDIYNFDTKQWIELAKMNDIRFRAGICKNDDYIEPIVYVGGGIRALTKVEYYNSVKNKWIKIKDTVRTHGTYPKLWIDNQNQNILYIASSKRLVMERMDLRENIWNVFVSPKMKKNFKSVFGCDVLTGTLCRLVS